MNPGWRETKKKFSQDSLITHECSFIEIDVFRKMVLW